MIETIKPHLDAIAEALKGSKHSFLFLMADGDTQHAVKNCEPHNQAALMVNYLEGTPDVETAFTGHVMNLIESEENSTLLEGLSENLDEKGIQIIENQEQ